MKSGVYVLYNQDICVYVGSSVDMNRRIRNHNKRGLFDRSELFQCPIEDLSENEAAKMKEMRPTLNKSKVRFYLDLTPRQEERLDNLSSKLSTLLSMKVTRKSAIMIALHRSFKKEGV